LNLKNPVGPRGIVGSDAAGRCVIVQIVGVAESGSSGKERELVEHGRELSLGAPLWVKGLRV
jgi:hypothetical protein